MRSIAVMLLLGCSTRAPEPMILAVTPAEGPSHRDVAIEIQVDHLLLAIEIDYRSGRSTIDPNVRVLLGELELTAALVARGRIQATIPAGAPLGAHAVTVIDSSNRSATLEAAYSVRREEPSDPSRYTVGSTGRATAIATALEQVSPVDDPMRAPWWDQRWGSRRAIVLEPASGTFPDSTDFAVLVRLDSTRIDYALAGTAGGDLRFVADDQATVLAHEIGSWDRDGTSYVWVSLPEARAGTMFWMYYQNPSALDGEDAPRVWNPEFDAVFHLGPRLIDSTEALDMVNNVGAALVPGAVADGRAFDGTALIDIRPNLISTSAGTITLVARTPSNDFDYGFDHSIAFYATDSTSMTADGIGEDNELHLGIDPEPAGNLFFFFIEGGADPALDVRIWSAQDHNDGQWHHIAAVWDLAAGYARLYVDGALSGEDMHTAFDFVASAYTRLGRPRANTRGYRGALDELRILGVPKDADWISAQHLNMNDQLLRFLDPPI